MRNTQEENVLEHAVQVAMIAHALATIKNTRYGGSVHAERTAMLALYHDAGEVITGDMVSPIKHFSPEIKAAVGKVEDMAVSRLLDMLPEDLRGAYAPLLWQDVDPEERCLVKAADKLSAYFKCLEEVKAGNGEFEKARDAIKRQIDGMDAPEVRDFMREFAPSFTLTLDELN